MAAVVYPDYVPIGKSATGADVNLPLAECLNNQQLIEENKKLEKDIRDQKKFLAEQKQLSKQYELQLRAQERKRQVLRKELIGKENKIKQLRANSVLMQMSASIRDKKIAANEAENAANEAANDKANVMIKNLLKRNSKTIQAKQKQIDKLEQEVRNDRDELQRHKREMENHKYNMDLISKNIRNIQQLLGPRFNQYAATRGYATKEDY